MAAKRIYPSLWFVSACVILLFSGIYGEVPDDTVYTELHKDVRIGESAVLTCRFRGSPLAVYWKKGDDPRRAPNLVSWIPTDDVTGKCEGQRPCEIMEMNENRSLVIKEVSMAEQGRYICRVSSYKGILIHNFTDIRLFSPPIEPYPIINECQRKEGSMNSTSPKGCRISTDTIVNITCSVFGFYPDINLFFLHGSSKVSNFKSIEWTNEDGSKNKTILIEATVSDRPYVCIASDIPGSSEERGDEIFIDRIRLDQTTSANPEKGDGSSGTNPAKIVVPILLILIVATAGVVFLWWRSRKRLARSHTDNRGVEESELLVQRVKVQGVVSFYDLWLLAYETPNGEMAKVYTALVKLGITNIKGLMDKGLVYDALCEWKERSYVRDQPQMLRDALEEVGLETRWQEIYDNVRQVNNVTKVPERTLEQILLDLKGKRAIKKFLNNLLQRESIGIQNETIGVAHGSEEDKGKSANEEGNMAMENTVPVEEAIGTNDGKGNNEDSAPSNGTNDGKRNKEDSAPANGTNDGKGNNEDSAPAKGTNDGKGNKEDSAPANRTNDGKGNNEDSAPASGTNDGKGNNEDPSPTNGTNDGKGNNEHSSPANGTNDGKGNNEDSVPANGTNDGKGNNEDSASAKETDTHDGKGSKKDSHPTKESKQEEVYQHVQAMEEVEYTKGMRTLKEWNKRPFRQNPFVLVSLALERAGFLHISKTFFDGPVSFYELRSLMYNVNTPSLEKLRKTICELEVDATSVVQFGPQQIYDSLCQWKEGHPQVDQGKILHNALIRAGHEEAWSKILEQRKGKSDVCESTFRKILRDVKEPAKIQQLLQNLDPNMAQDVETSLKTDFMQKALEALKDWNKRSLNENKMILLSRALEKAKCKPIDRTFLCETISYFELWSMVHYDFETDVITLPLHEALKAMGIQGIEETTGEHDLYHLLCEWKDEHCNCDQQFVLKIHFLNEGLDKEWENLSDLRCGTDRVISSETLEHILWHLKTSGKINAFLHQLTNTMDTHQELIPDNSNPPENINIALSRLELWKKGPFDKHPVILLSEALESAKCSDVAMTFFQVLVHLQKSIGDEEVREFVRRLTGRHRKRLSNETPATEDKKISNFAEENNEILFDAKSMVRDWIENEQCCNYEKRCKLDDSLIEIGRHDMTDFFGTIQFRRNTDPELSAKIHPESKTFHLMTIFKDDLIRLSMLITCLDEDLDLMEKFCRKVGIPLKVVEPRTKSSDMIDIRKWRDSHLQYTVKEVFSKLSGFMTNKTKVKFVTDQELDWLVSQVTTDDKLEKFTDKKKVHWRRSKRIAGKLRATLSLLSEDQDGKSQPKAEGTLSPEGTFEEEAGSHIESQEEDISSSDLGQQLRLWRRKHVDKWCRKSLRSAFKSVGLEECIVNRTPRERMYEVEIVRAAFHILMRDVRPIIEALGINQKTSSKYMRQCPGLEKGSLDLLLQICKSESYNRLDFCLTLTQMGYVDVARSIYLDHEMSTSELARIAFVLNERDQAKFKSLIDQLDLRPEELPECLRAYSKVDCLEVLRTWKEKIKPVPYHYRRHIVDGLQAVRCSDLADEVLRGLYRQEFPEEDAIEIICSRLDDGQIHNLVRILKLKPDDDEQDRKMSTNMIVRWADKWMRKYDSSAKSFKERRSVNNELVREGFYELAHEIMVLEYSKF